MGKFLVILASLAFVFGFASVGLCKGTLIAAYSFDNDPAGKVNDVTGNGNIGVIKNAKYVDGKFGKGLEFAGADSHVEIAHNNILNIKESITIEAWVKPTKYNDLSAVAQKWGDNSNRRQYLLCFVGDKLRFYISGAGNTWPSAASESSVKVGEWTHIAGTYDSKAIKVYINGKLEGETANNEGIFASDIPAMIGGYGPDAEFGSNRHFPGVVDEVRFWSGTLTQAEIQQGMLGPTTLVNMHGKLSTTWSQIKN